MNTREFIASLIDSLAWPLALVIVALIFRPQIVDLLSKGLTRMKAGPFEAEWTRAEQRIPNAIRAKTAPRTPDSVSRETADVSPRAAILTRFDEVIEQLADAVTERLGDQPDGQSAGELIDVAQSAGMIDAGTKQALVGINVMRNLTAHGPEREIDAEKVVEFMALADATEYAMNHWLSQPPAVL